jgi:hypothetical protein
MLSLLKGRNEEIKEWITQHQHTRSPLQQVRSLVSINQQQQPTTSQCGQQKQPQKNEGENTYTQQQLPPLHGHQQQQQPHGQPQQQQQNEIEDTVLACTAQCTVPCTALVPSSSSRLACHSPFTMGRLMREHHVRLRSEIHGMRSLALPLFLSLLVFFLSCSFDFVCLCMNACILA